MSSIITTNMKSTITAPTYTTTSAMPRNSASARIQVQATVKNASTRHSAACTGLRTLITAPAATTVTTAKARKASSEKSMRSSAERRVCGAALGDLGFEPVAQREQLRLGDD